MITKVIVVLLLIVKCAICSKHVKLIIGGNDAELLQFPHSAFLGVSCIEHKHREAAPYSCGSAILNQKIIITAAHCVDRCLPSSTIVIKVGNKYRDKGNTVTVKRFVMHERYDDFTIENDIALASLKKKLTFGPLVARVAIMRKPPADDIAHVAGWGVISEHNEPSVILQETEQDILSNKKCKKIMLDIPRKTLCAENIMKQSRVARGDSGSALVIRHFIQVGIVSYYDPIRSNSIAVYTKVSSFYDWIAKTSKYLYCG